jgi:hypothetical protein
MGERKVLNRGIGTRSEKGEDQERNSEREFLEKGLGVKTKEGETTKGDGEN